MSSPYHPLYSLIVREADLDELLPAIADAGFEGIEPTFVTGALPSPEDPAKSARRLKDKCDELGLTVPSLRGGRVPWDTIPSPDPAERTRAIRHTESAIEALSILGGAVLLVVPGDRRPDVRYEQHWERVVEYGSAAADLGRAARIRIGLENVEARFPTSVRDWRDLVDDIDHPNLGMYLDVGNVTWLGLGYPEHWIRSLGRRIVQVHFKDARYNLAGDRLTAEIDQLLDGRVNWPAVMLALAEIGYDGWVGVEPEPRNYHGSTLPRRLYRDLTTILENHGEEEP